MDLKIKTVKNIGFVFSSTFFSTSLQIISRIVLAWYLIPEDFGVFAIGSLSIGVLETIRGLGIGSALIYKKEELRKSANTAFWIQLLMGFVFFIFLFLLSPFIGDFFGDTSVTLVTRVLSIIFVINALGTIPNLLLEKQLNFKKSVFAQVFSNVVFFISAVYFAFIGFGIWALVYSSILLSLSNAIALYVIFSWRPKIEFDWGIARELIGYGKYVLFAGLLTFLTINIDRAIIGKILGMELLGFYALAFFISNLPATQISLVINRVMFPTYTTINYSRERLLNAYRKTLKYVSIICFPLAFLIFILASELVINLLGEKWLPAIILIQLLSLFGLIRVLGGVPGTIFLAIGKPRLLMYLEILHLSLLIFALIPFTLFFGVVGACIALIIVVLIAVSTAFIIANKAVSEKNFTTIKGLLNPLMASALMLLVVCLVNFLLPESNVIKLISLFFFGVIGYLFAISALEKNLFNEIRNDFLSKNKPA